MAKLDLNMFLTGEANTQHKIPKVINRDKLVDKIKEIVIIGDEVKEILLNKLNNYPDESLRYFVRNFKSIVNKSVVESLKK